MAGLFDDCSPFLSRYYSKLNLDKFYLKEKRNTVSSIVAGCLFSIGWWIIIDCAVLNPSNQQFHKAFIVIGIMASLALVLVNSISDARFRGDLYGQGCCGSISLSRIVLFLAFLFAFGSLISGAWVMIVQYIIPDKKPMYPGIAIFLQNLLIFTSTLVFKFGRVEDTLQF